MRQAGRYLPEYRAVREQAGGFLDLCYTPALAAEVTLQPIRRFGFDAAILFSDILVVPHALGQRVEFREGEGPCLEPVRSAAELARLDAAGTGEKFGRVFETVARVRQDLPREVALIGFCGAPWTVATYMVEGGGSSDQAEARLWAYRDPDGFARLIDLLTETSIDYLDGQVRAGAGVLQIFDSWAGALPDRSSSAGWWRRRGESWNSCAYAIRACRSSASRAGRARTRHATWGRQACRASAATPPCRSSRCASSPTASACRATSIRCCSSPAAMSSRSA